MTRICPSKTSSFSKTARRKTKTRRKVIKRQSELPAPITCRAVETLFSRLCASSRQSESDQRLLVVHQLSALASFPKAQNVYDSRKTSRSQSQANQRKTRSQPKIRLGLLRKAKLRLSLPQRHQEQRQSRRLSRPTTSQNTQAWTTKLAKT